MNFFNLIKEICLEENIDLKEISQDWIFELIKNNKRSYICGHSFPLNTQAVENIIKDKSAFSDLCHFYHIPIIEHKILWSPESSFGKETPKLLEKYFKAFDNNVVIKPNMGKSGDGVYHIDNLEELKKKSELLFKSNLSISICPFYDIESEYRLIMLDNEVKFVFQKVKPVVIGNGIESIKDLLIAMNPKYFENMEFSKKYNRILNTGEVFEYDWRFNLSKGAIAKNVTDNDLLNKLSDMAINVSKITQARFISIDIIKIKDKLSLIEANSGVYMNKVCNFIDKDYKISKEIYREAIKKMFE